jgi:hypothetical protein
VGAQTVRQIASETALLAGAAVAGKTPRLGIVVTVDAGAHDRARALRDARSDGLY